MISAKTTLQFVIEEQNHLKKCASICIIEGFYANCSQALNENQMKKSPRDSIQIHIQKTEY